MIDRAQQKTIQLLSEAMTGLWLEAFHDASGLPTQQFDGHVRLCPLCGARDSFFASIDVARKGCVQCQRCFRVGTNLNPGCGVATLQWLLKCDTKTTCEWIANWLDGGESAVVPIASISRPHFLHDQSVPLGSLDEFVEECRIALQPDQRLQIARMLQTTTEVLLRLQLGWSHLHQAITWPMVGIQNKVVGVRLQSMQPRIESIISVGKDGVFVPTGLSDSVERLFVAEGPISCAAILSIGFDAIGRPAMDGAVAITAKLVQRMKPHEVVIVADADPRSSGERRSQSLAVAIVTVCPRVRVILPPTGFSKAHEWLSAGATVDDFLTVIDAAKVRSLAIKAVAL